MFPAWWAQMPKTQKHFCGVLTKQFYLWHTVTVVQKTWLENPGTDRALSKQRAMQDVHCKPYEMQRK